MNKYAKGRRLEYKAKKILEAQGYTVFRTAGSHGLFDLVAINKAWLKLIQVKSNNTLTKIEYEKLRAFNNYPSKFLRGYKEVWHFENGKPEPHIVLID